MATLSNDPEKPGLLISIIPLDALTMISEPQGLPGLSANVVARAKTGEQTNRHKDKNDGATRGFAT